MKRLAVLTLSLAVVAGSANAGDTYVPDNAPSGICNHFPFNATWTGSNGEWRYQAIYTAAQLGNQQALFTGMALAPCTTGLFQAKQFEVRMANLAPSTHSTNLDTNIAGATTVRAPGSFSWSVTGAAWNAIAFDCPHIYDGKSDLVVEVRYIGGAISGGFTGTVARASVAQRYYVSGTGAYTTPVATGQGLSAFKIRLIEADITAPASLSIGTATKMQLDAFHEANQTYVAASSFGIGPINLGCWQVLLAPDAVFFLSVNNLAPSVFQNYQSQMDANGQGTIALALPNVPGIVGQGVSTAFVTLDKAGLRCASRNALIKIIP